MRRASDLRRSQIIFQIRVVEQSWSLSLSLPKNLCHVWHFQRGKYFGLVESTGGHVRLSFSSIYHKHDTTPWILKKKRKLYTVVPWSLVNVVFVEKCVPKAARWEVIWTLVSHFRGREIKSRPIVWRLHVTSSSRAVCHYTSIDSMSASIDGLPPRVLLSNITGGVHEGLLSKRRLTK